MRQRQEVVNTIGCLCADLMLDSPFRTYLYIPNIACRAAWRINFFHTQKTIPNTLNWGKVTIHGEHQAVCKYVGCVLDAFYNPGGCSGWTLSDSLATWFKTDGHKWAFYTNVAGLKRKYKKIKEIKQPCTWKCFTIYSRCSHRVPQVTWPERTPMRMWNYRPCAYQSGDHRAWR